MGWEWVRPETDVLSERAVQAMTVIDDGLARARAALLVAGHADWVSDAAERYRSLLDETLADVARADRALGAARAAVLRHARAADVVRAERDALRMPFLPPAWAPPGTLASDGASGRG